MIGLSISCLISIVASAPPNAGVNFEGVEIDEVTRGRVLACYAQLLECRQEAASGRAKFTYTREAARRKPPFNLKEFEGELTWKGAKCKYVVHRKGESSLFDYAAVMTEAASFIGEMGPANFYTFHVTHPMRNATELNSQKLVKPICVDPIVYWQAGTVALFAPPKGRKVSSSVDQNNIYFVQEIKGSDGVVKTRLHYTFSADTMLPTAFFMNDVLKGKWQKVLSIDTEWKQFNKCWHLSVYRHTYHVPQEDGTMRPCPILIHFTDVSLNVDVSDRELSPESLPLPEGLLGIDKRKSPSIPIYFSKNGLTHERPAEVAWVGANTPDADLNEEIEASQALELRNRFYRRTASYCVAGLSASLAAASMFYWFRRRAKSP